MVLFFVAHCVCVAPVHPPQPVGRCVAPTLADNALHGAGHRLVVPKWLLVGPQGLPRGMQGGMSRPSGFFIVSRLSQSCCRPDTLLVGYPADSHRHRVSIKHRCPHFVSPNWEGRHPPPEDWGGEGYGCPPPRRFGGSADKGWKGPAAIPAVVGVAALLSLAARPR